MGDDEKLNPFARDIVKSFILACVPKPSKELIQFLVHLMNHVGKNTMVFNPPPKMEEATELTTQALDGYFGKHEKIEFSEDNVVLENSDGKLKIMIILK